MIENKKEEKTMKNALIISTLLLLCIFGAGCVNIAETESGTIPELPAEAHPPTTLEPIVGEWDGYDTKTQTSYELTCLYNGYAKLETESADIERTYFGAWEGANPNYQLKLNAGDYQMELGKNGDATVLTTPDGTKVSMQYDSF